MTRNTVLYYLLYMSVLAGIDTSLYEAAEIDGSNKRQQIKHITNVSLIPLLFNGSQLSTRYYGKLMGKWAKWASSTRIIGFILPPTPPPSIRIGPCPGGPTSPPTPKLTAAMARKSS
ncbi:MAG: hypothetical protein IJ041_08730 [Clostridia bacterium]|nr:hypothetical protein [Clostridia bacterium]